MVSKSKHIEILGRAAVVEEQRLLLCRNVAGGYLFLPGGHVEWREHARIAVAREMREETGCEVRVGNLLTVIEAMFKSDRWHHEINLIYRVERVHRNQPIRSLEPDIAFEWHRVDALSSLPLRPSEVAQWVFTNGPNWTV